MSLSIDQMRLNPIAKAAAIALMDRCPFVIFTSGRRDCWGQAVAMAQNTVADRSWVARTYLHAAIFSTWLDQHPESRTVEQVSHGFYALLQNMSDHDRTSISKHLSGDAFDVLPLLHADGTTTEQGQRVIAAIRALPELQTFLEKEGSLIRWHAQFVESADV